MKKRNGDSISKSTMKLCLVIIMTI